MIYILANIWGTRGYIEDSKGHISTRLFYILEYSGRERKKICGLKEGIVKSSPEIWETFICWWLFFSL